MSDANLKTAEELKEMLSKAAQDTKSLNENVTTASGAVVGGPAPQTPPTTPPTTGV